MIKSLKRLLLIIPLAIMLIGLSVKAEESFDITLPNEFYSHKENSEKISQILDITPKNLTEYCSKNNIIYLALNEDNTKQIKVTISENEFSNSIINLSNLSDDKISALSEDIVGIKDIRGYIISLNGQKFLKTVAETEDSGGKYILTQYTTCAKRKVVTISFYTASTLETNYTDDVFITTKSSMFIYKENAPLKAFKAAVPMATIAFALICISLIGSVILDIKNRNSQDEDDGDENFKETQEEEKNIDN